MNLLTRRVAVVGAMAAATVAAALTTRKWTEVGPPPGALILRPANEGPPRLRPLAEAIQRFAAPKPMPAIRFTSADGTPKTLADFAGKGVVLNFWATWCAPCGAELPSLDALAGQVAADNIIVLPLASDRGGAAAVAGYYRAHNIRRLGVWLDPDGAAMHAVAARGIPTTLVVDRQGRARAIVEGGADWQAQSAAATIGSLAG